MIDFQGGGLRDTSFELWAELCNVVGKERGLVAGTGHSDIPKPGIEQVWMYTRIGVDQNTLRGQPLRAVAGNSVSMIEMSMGCGVEFRSVISAWPLSQCFSGSIVVASL